MISYKLGSNPNALGLIIGDLYALLIFGYPCLTAQESPKVKSDHIKRFPTHDFLTVSMTFQVSWINS